LRYWHHVSPFVGCGGFQPINGNPF
jgi:hypothetical protein